LIKSVKVPLGVVPVLQLVYEQLLVEQQFVLVVAVVERQTVLVAINN
jgi:hypothetical protein